LEDLGGLARLVVEQVEPRRQQPAFLVHRLSLDCLFELAYCILGLKTELGPANFGSGGKAATRD